MGLHTYGTRDEPNPYHTPNTKTGPPAHRHCSYHAPNPTPNTKNKTNRYDADGGQTQLKPHRDGSVVSFNVALNPSSEFDGGGTYFAGLQDALRIEQVGVFLGGCWRAEGKGRCWTCCAGLWVTGS